MSEAIATPSAPAVDQASTPSESSQPSGEKVSVSPGGVTDKVKIKLDGKEVAVDSSAIKRVCEDLGITEETFLRDYGTSASATRKAQETAKLRKEVEAEKAQLQEAINGLKNDPEALWNLMQKLGHDPERLAEERVWKKIQYEKMSPEAREAMSEKQRADAAEQRLKDIEDAEASKNSKALAQAAEAEIESDVLKVLELSKRKAEPGLIRRVAEIYESYMLAKKTKPSHEYVVGKLRDLRRQEFTEDLSGTDIEELANTLPKEFLSRLQDHLVKKARTRDLPNITPSGSAPSTTPKQKPERVTIDQFFKNL